MKFLTLLPLAMPVIVLLGCGVAVPTPKSARLSADQLTVSLSDGSTCRAPTGAGRMPLCGAGYSYKVELAQNPNILRQFVQGAFAALGADGALAPMGQVTLTDHSGREYRFVSPVPVPE